MKRALLIGSILILLIAIPVGVYLVRRQQELRLRAAPATTISFEPATKTVRVDETFSLNVMLDTGVNSAATAEVHIGFDVTKLTATEIRAGSFMPHALVTSTPDNTQGRAFIAVDTLPADASSESVPRTKRSDGPKPIAVVTFKGKVETGASPSQVRFLPETTAFGETAGTLEPTNLILSASLANAARITVSAQTVGPTPTPTGAAPQNRPPSCNSLTAVPATGRTPLTVTLTANASDQDNDVVSALFTFGDGQTQTVDKNVGRSGSIQVSHVYQSIGNLTAQAIVRDNNGAVSAACTTTVSITSGTGGAAATPSGTSDVPSAGGQPIATATPISTTQKIPVTSDIEPTKVLSIVGGVLLLIGTLLFFAL